MARKKTSSSDPFEGKRFRVFVLGAGFSRAAGLPLGVDLWREIRRRADLLSGRASHFKKDLERYIAYRTACDGETFSVDEIEFEDFMAFLDVEHFLGLRGSDTWSDDGNETTVVVKTLIGEILTDYMPKVIPDIYLDFAKGLRPDDYVLTFNYDVLLERSLEAAGTPYRLFPSRYKTVNGMSATVDDSRSEVIVLKLHGSIDWFDRTQYSQREQAQRDAGLKTPPGDPVFPYVKELGITKLLEGPRFADDPLDQMYRVHDIAALYRRGVLFSAPPWLLAPSATKLVYASRIREFFYGMNGAGSMNFGLAIIGYSLPQQDAYARQILYEIVTNYQEVDWDKDFYGVRKSPLLIVDFCPDNESLEVFKKRYRFVQWSRAVLHKSGFDMKAVAAAIG